MGSIDAEELGRLLDEKGRALVLFARQWCSAAEDVVQEVFIELVKQDPPPADILAWLYAAVRNRAKSAARSEIRRRERESSAAASGRSWFEPSLAGPIDAETAAAMLATLPNASREVIVAHLWGGLSFRQIAEAFGIPSSTIHRRYQEGLAVLRERLERQCPTRETS